MNIKRNNLYIYVGQGEGKGEIHKLIEATDETCVTWGRTRMAWKGTKLEFMDNFEPLEQTA